MESPHLLRASKWGECAFKTGGLRHGCYAVHIAVKAGTIVIGGPQHRSVEADELCSGGPRPEAGDERIRLERDAYRVLGEGG